MIASHIVEAAAPIPYEVNPLALMISYAFLLVDVAMAVRSVSSRGRREVKGTPETLAADQAT